MSHELHLVKLPGGKVHHELTEPWTFWYMIPNRMTQQTQNWEDFLTPLHEFYSVEDFWAIYNTIDPPPANLPKGCRYYVFKTGIRPLWEDVWSLGVTLYQTFYQTLPFKGGTVYEIVQYSKTHTLELPDDSEPLLNNLIQSMLQVDPAKRFNIQQVASHEFFKDYKQIPLSSEEYKPELDQFAEYKQIDAIVCDESYSFATIQPAHKLQERLKFH